MAMRWLIPGRIISPSGLRREIHQWRKRFPRSPKPVGR
jgi:hypothetical protein